MKVIAAPMPGVLILEPKVFTDPRGFFLESYNRKALAELGIADSFVQDNHSFSQHNVLRGLHYQIHHPQGKLVRVLSGEIFDVVVDLRRSSATFGKWHGARLSGENHLVLWVAPGFAHGFHVESAGAHVLYKTTDFYDAQSERTLAWNDPALNINWSVKAEPITSDKDKQGTRLKDAEVFD